ncbi:MAG TPA: YhjD/YihY/BrkB family envelope integrity protein [Ilumatobacteraceae bacterium]
MLARLRTRAERLLDRWKERPVFGFGDALFRRDREIAGTLIGSAIAFRMFLFFVPLLLFIVGTVGFVAELIETETAIETTGVSGSLADQIETALEQPNATRWFAVVFGLFGMITTGRTLGKVVVTASSLAWQLPLRPKAGIKVIGMLIGIFAGIGVITVIVNRVRDSLGIGVATISIAAAFTLYTSAWFALTLALPRAARDVTALLPGAVLVGTVTTGMQVVSQLYLPDRLSRASQLYGAIGITIVTLGWFFIVGRALVGGMVLNAVIHERYGSLTEQLRAIPVVGRFVPDLEPGGDSADDEQQPPVTPTT